jgi:hypothetical protein
VFPGWKALARLPARKIDLIPARRRHALVGVVAVQRSVSCSSDVGVEPFWVGSLIAPHIELRNLHAVVREGGRDVSPMGDTMIYHRHEDQAGVIVKCPPIARFMHLGRWGNVLQQRDERVVQDQFVRQHVREAGIAVPRERRCWGSSSDTQEKTALGLQNMHQRRTNSAVGAGDGSGHHGLRERLAERQEALVSPMIVVKEGQHGRFEVLIHTRDLQLVVASQLGLGDAMLETWGVSWGNGRGALIQGYGHPLAV